MAYNPNIPAPANRVQDDIAAMRGNFQHLAPLAQAVGELQTVSGLAPYVQAILDSRIVEMGSNSNGTYVRWENGLQICFGGQRATGRTSAYTYSVFWTCPAAFVGAPTAVGVRSNDGTTKAARLVGPSIRSISNTSANYYISDPDGGFADGETWYVYPIAIGRWK